MTTYTCCFAFSENNVLLIRKATPEWQRGFLNGIGGKVEDGETVLDATVREFKEETLLWGEVINPIVFHAMLWREFATHKNWPLVYFSACEISPAAMHKATVMTAPLKEPCIMQPLNKLGQGGQLMPNLPFLLEMAHFLTRCKPDERKLRQPVVLPPYLYAMLIDNGLELDT